MSTTVDTTHKRLYVSGIPADQNNVQKLSEHFEKFGTISKIIVNYHGQPGAAVVTFASHNDANAAMNNQQPVFGNPGIQVRWGIRTPKQSSTTQSAPQSTSSSSPSPASPASPASPSSPPSQSNANVTFQCEKCSKILSTKQTLKNHMRHFHGQFQCPECPAMFESGNEYRKHYNAVHSDSKDFTQHSNHSKEFGRQNASTYFNFQHVNETLRQENYSLKKKLKKHKKNKLKVHKELQDRLVKLLEGELIGLSTFFKQMYSFCVLNFFFLFRIYRKE